MYVDGREEQGLVLRRSGGRTINGGVRVVFELPRGPVDEDLDWRRVLRRHRAPGHVRDPEIEDLDPPVGRDEHVFRLQVTMDDAAAVRGRDRLLERLPRRERTGLKPLTQRRPFEQLGHGVHGVALAADIVERDDVGVREGGDGATFALESRECLWIGRVLEAQELDGDVTPSLVSRAR